jgi:glutamine synthetase adenylyltransferase
MRLTLTLCFFIPTKDRHQAQVNVGSNQSRILRSFPNRFQVWWTVGGEGAAYRVIFDFALMVVTDNGVTDEAVRYYERSAQDWERQALILVRPARPVRQRFSRALRIR